MISENFTIKGYDRLVETQHFIKENMPTARFRGNPIQFDNDLWDVSVTYEIQDINKLGQHLERYRDDKIKITSSNSNELLYNILRFIGALIAITILAILYFKM